MKKIKIIIDDIPFTIDLSINIDLNINMLRYITIARDAARKELNCDCGNKYCDHYTFFIDEIKTSTVSDTANRETYISFLQQELKQYNSSYKKVLQEIEKLLILF